MNKLLTLFNELDEKNSLEFIGSCAAKQRNLIGVPRIVLKNNQKLKTEHLKFLVTSEKNYFESIDNKFDEFIVDELLDDFLSSIDFLIIFDTCRISFLEDDELFNFLPSKFRKIFNLNVRNEEKHNFMHSNKKHITDDNNITTKVIFTKLNTIWKNKWNKPEVYLNEYDEIIINNILNA